MMAHALVLHSWMRWVTLILAVAAVANAARPLSADGRVRGRGWDRAFMTAFDIQVLLGLFLYFDRDMVQALNHMSETMRTTTTRFFAIEHIFGMLAAMVLVRVGRVRSAGAPTPASARSRRLLWFSLALLALLVSIPWPGLPYGRPLIRY